MQITIDNPEALLQFCKRDYVTANDAIDIFERAFNIVAIVFVDAITREPNFVKEKVIKKIEDYVNNCKIGKYDKVVLFS